MAKTQNEVTTDKKAVAKQAVAKPAVTKTVATTSTAKNTVKAAAGKTDGTKEPRKPAGRVLRKEPIELPRRPEHHYGRVVLASSVAVGDVLYTGNQRNLNTVEVLGVNPEKANPGTHLLIEVAAISLFLDGQEHTAGERAYLRVARDASLAVRFIAAG